MDPATVVIDSRALSVCQVTKSPRVYVLFRTAVPGIKPVTRLPFAGLSGGLGGTEPVTLHCLFGRMATWSGTYYINTA